MELQQKNYPKYRNSRVELTNKREHAPKSFQVTPVNAIANSNGKHMNKKNENRIDK